MMLNYWWKGEIRFSENQKALKKIYSSYLFLLWILEQHNLFTIINQFIHQTNAEKS